ncbi:hypothetical protein DW083_05460 [Parabacteroides sp. AF48-14]|uniref:hypothetical protein n=1 Tax=Parabacteroides sp. AF48-14 TaxID=2292052 RepID=UPI000EFF511F|nr:hypothetical protein [Parabacteroides sp. AF48-14]RHO73611.1 hypothetical protein DW083_05460 [Parabacteroides sp. AF48-14]
MRIILFVFFVACLAQSSLSQNIIEDIFSKSLEVVSDKGRKELYKGQIIKKKRTGMGLLKMKDGALYIGDFSKGEMTGYGMLLVPEGNSVSNCDNCAVYVGNWQDGEKTGSGVCYAKNGDVLYSGKFKEDRPINAYGSTDDSPLRYFSLFENSDGNMFLGEVNDGNFNGFGVIVFNDGDLWFGNFRNGLKQGVGLYLMYDGEWETLNFKDDSYDVISSSANYRDVEHSRSLANKQSFGFIMDNFAAAATATAGAVNSARTIRQSDGNSSGLAASDNSGSSGNNKSGSKQGNKKASNCGSSWSIDSNTYSNYETQLIKMRTYPEKYDNYTADYASIQSKMRQIRTKWEARGCSITKSQYE